MRGCEVSEDSSWRWWMRTWSPVHLTRPALVTAAPAGPGRGVGLTRWTVTGGGLRGPRPEPGVAIVRIRQKAWFAPGKRG